MKKINNQNNKKKHKILSEKKKSDRNTRNTERVKFDEMNQIEWFPVDPYCD